MSTYEEAIQAIGHASDAIGEVVRKARQLDRLQPSCVRVFNGEIDDLLIEVQKIEAARTRLMGRTGAARGQGDDLLVPNGAGQAAGQLDGLPGG
jgi:hypothetical protein